MFYSVTANFCLNPSDQEQLTSVLLLLKMISSLMNYFLIQMKIA